MNIAVKVSVMATLCYSVFGCGGRSSPEAPGPTGGFLAPQDVTALPAGDAQGQSRSGVYALQGVPNPNECSCRSGSCADFPYSAWWIVNLGEDNGSLTLTRARGTFLELPCTGGIDADGRLWCGAARDGSLFRLDGLISTGDGTMALSSKEVVTEPVAPGHDCDIRQSAIFLPLGT